MLAVYDSNFTACDYLVKSQKGWSEKTTLDKELLQRAKRGLRSLTFFGLSERQIESRDLFEKTFQQTLVFNQNFKQAMAKIGDIQLYRYASKLFAYRLIMFNL